MYLAPPSVDLDIREFRHKGLTDELNGHDVVKWALEQSCRQIELYRPLHVKQGLSFFYRRYVARQNPLHEDVESPTELADSPLVEHETQSLHDLYAPAAMQNEAERHLITLCRRAQDTDIQRLLREYDSLKLSSQSRIAIHEEHEREIEQEVEKQAQISRPGPMTPAVPFVDPQLDEYVREGSENLLLRFSYAHELLVARSSAAHELRGSTTIWKHIRASAGFASVIENWDFGNIDSTLRPVNWVLVSNKESNEGGLLLISQYEANHIFDAIVGHDANVRLFSYEPRVSRVMIARDPQPTVLSDDDRCEWTSLVPPHITRELYLFAGQLYIPSYEEYLCFKNDMEGYHADQTSPPMTFYKEWFGIRRRGQDFLPTHMGQIVEGKTLPEGAFKGEDGCWNGEEYKQIWDGGDLMDWKTEDGVKDECDIEDEDSVKDEDDLKDEDEIKSEEGIKAENEEKPDVKAEDKITEEKLADSKEEAMDWKPDEEGCSLRVVSLDENENMEENSSSFEGFSPAQSVARHEDHVDDDDDSDEDLFMADHAD